MPHLGVLSKIFEYGHILNQPPLICLMVKFSAKHTFLNLVSKILF